MAFHLHKGTGVNRRDLLRLHYHYNAFSDSMLCFVAKTCPAVLAITFRSRLFLFPVDCSLFPLRYLLPFRQYLHQSRF